VAIELRSHKRVNPRAAVHFERRFVHLGQIMFNTACTSSPSGITGAFLRRDTTRTMFAWKSRIDDRVQGHEPLSCLATLCRSISNVNSSQWVSFACESGELISIVLSTCLARAQSPREGQQREKPRDSLYYQHFQIGSQQYRAGPTSSSSVPRRRRNRTDTRSPAAEQVARSDSQNLR